MRAKESAQSSSSLIEDIVQKVRGGVSLVNVTSTAFSQVTTSSEKVVELMGEIRPPPGSRRKFCTLRPRKWPGDGLPASPIGCCRCDWAFLIEKRRKMSGN